MSYIYFIRCRGRVKIGRAHDIAKRMSAMQVGCPYELEFLGYEEGGMGREAELHKMFEHLHCHGEWFKFGSIIKTHVEWRTVHAMPSPLIPEKTRRRLEAETAEAHRIARQYEM